MRRQLSACVAILLYAVITPLWASTMNVVFINPGRSDEPFWRSVTRFMQPAAHQLHIDLEVLYAERDHLKMIDLTKQVVARKRKPNYLMIVNEKLAGGEMLKLADQAGLKTLLVFSTFQDEQAEEFGQPREKFHFWLGSLVPNTEDAGRLSASELVQQSHARGAVASDGKVHIAAIAGDKVTPTATERLSGALQAFASDPSVVLEQVVYGNWDRARAKEQAQALMLRYPMLNAFWTASDLMAFGAMDAVEMASRKPGEDMLISTFNNSPETLQARVQGRISSLVGGHFTVGAFGLVMLYDYHHGRDFMKEGLQLQTPVFAVLDERRARIFLNRFGDEDFSAVDFRRHSKHLHPKIRSYQFSLLPELK